MSEPGLRIMWQLIQSSVASLILLAGMVMVFGSRGGNVLIHLGVGLLMLGQFAFGDRQIEERMALVEGQSSTMALRTDETELAVIRPDDGENDRVTVISGRLLKARSGGDAILADDLPFDVRVLSYFPNSNVIRVGPVAPNQATTGLGKSWLATDKAPEGGASSRPNIASAYVQLRDRKTGADLGTFLVSQFLNDQAQLFMGAGGDELDVEAQLVVVAHGVGGEPAPPLGGVGVFGGHAHRERQALLTRLGARVGGGRGLRRVRVCGRRGIGRRLLRRRPGEGAGRFWRH
jgi:hypothetical protein